MANSSVVEYEIGLLVRQALDKVGLLVGLTMERGHMHADLANHAPQALLDVTVVQSVLHQALREAFEAQSSRPATPTNGTLHEATPASSGLATLTSHQIQELGATFGRNPGAFGEVVSRMWHTGTRCPDLLDVVTRSSNLIAPV